MDHHQIPVYRLGSHILLTLLSIASAIYISVGYIDGQLIKYKQLQLPTLGELVTTIAHPSLRWPAVDLPHSGHVLRENGHTTVVGTSADAGFFLFGPYQTIVDGRYQLVINGEASGEGKLWHIQVVAENGRDVLYAEDLTGSDLPLDRELELPFAGKLEIRIAANSLVPVAIETVELKRKDIHWLPFIQGAPRRIHTFLNEFWKSDV